MNNLETVQIHFKRMAHAIEHNPSITVVGSIVAITGMKIEAIGLSVPIGTLCKIMISEKKYIEAEVIGFHDEITYLMAVEDMMGVKQGASVVPISHSHSIGVGMSLLGRILNASGEPLDGLGSIEIEEYYSLMTKPMNPLNRKRVSEALDVGVRVINGLLTVSKGQRVGIFAGSGVGKSVLLGMMTRYTKAEVVVVGLIGERGREVKEFIEENIGEEGLHKTVVVASPADTSPLMRANGALLATTIAEYFRDQGKDVLLIIDSLTRYAQAQREISLSAGEMPATKGFTPSVFAKLSQLVERSGNGTGKAGSITAFYTVLVEGDDHNEPIADHARSILDGHIVLSRQLADAGHYPAIDIEKSISRVMSIVAKKSHLDCANLFKKFYSTYNKNKDLIHVGMYQAGSDETIDHAIRYRDKMNDYLRQDTKECAALEECILKMESIFQPTVVQ